jgi:hypothetical protein
MTSWLLVAAAVLGWAVALALAFLLPGRGRQRAIEDALRLRAHVEPYLRRRAAELDGEPPAASDPARGPDAIVDHLCALADRLTERERKQVELGDTLNVGAQDTLPVTPVPPTKADR